MVIFQIQVSLVILFWLLKNDELSKVVSGLIDKNKKDEEKFFDPEKSRLKKATEWELMNVTQARTAL